MPKAGKIALIVVAGVAVIFCVGSCAFDRYVLDRVYARITPTAPSLLLTDADIAADYPYEDVEFQMNGATLRGHVYGTDNTRGLVVFRHGIHSHHQDYLALITALVDRGWKVFAYDAIGCGESDGESVIGFAQSPLDVRAAVDYAYESGMVGDMPVVLLGHSWGGYGVAGALDFADVRDRVVACVSMSGFDSPGEIMLESTLAQMGPVAYTQKPFVDLIELMDFKGDANRSASQAVGSCKIPTLLIHGTEDKTISYDGASIIADAQTMANPNVQTVTKDEPGRNGHNSYFYSRESLDYLTACNAELAALSDEYGGDVPADKLESFKASVDKRRANTADPVLIDEVDGFFGAVLDNLN